MKRTLLEKVKPDLEIIWQNFLESDAERQRILSELNKNIVECADKPQIVRILSNFKQGLIDAYEEMTATKEGAK